MQPLVTAVPLCLAVHFQTVSDSAPPAPSMDAAQPSRALWVMFLCLLSGFALSQAFRTVATIIATGLQADFGISPDSLGAFAGLFGLSFGVTQLLMGIGMDLYGLRRIVLTAFPFAVVGSTLSAGAPSYGWLMLGQMMIGVGCSPAFLACTVFISRHFPAQRFAFFSGVGVGIGGLGLIFTGTPLAWLVQHGGWRMGFGVLAVLSLLSWLLIYLRVHEPGSAEGADRPRESWKQAASRFGDLFRMPHTWGILVLGMCCYAAFLSLRGLWLGPLLMGRFGLSLIESGNVALVLSLIALFCPALFGRMDPGPVRRRRWLASFSLLMGGLFLLMAFLHHAAAAVVLIFAMGALSGFGVLQYADVRSSYPAEMTGRALSLFTMAMFIGVALMQWLTGLLAGWAQAQGHDPFQAVMLGIASMLAAASTAFRWLPRSPLLP
ncbi:putative MFS family arabinose efflux permease [Paracidovorax wautersii]|uniref:MFS family arabinose efflux permease n=2 Tax=Paracidovorax wautersii TaxID=1177982 RepID=A0ABU1I5I5_9BURK|nr:putative MFS family arabinose efflux permease [Paracidovorax wautersii]